MGGSKEDQARLFSVVPVKRQKAKKKEYTKSRLNLGKKKQQTFFLSRMFEHWNR